MLAEYAYDNLGRRVSVARADGAGATTSYTYDAASRLAQLQQNLSGSGADQTYSFTHSAAFQTLTRTGTNASYDWPAPGLSDTTYANNNLNQYTQVNSASFSYDARGNLTNTGSATYSYDAFNRLTAAGSATLAYDPAGRLYQTTGSATTRYLYDGVDVIAEYNTSGDMLRRYVHGPSVDEPVVWYEGSGTSDRRWYVQDQLGSVIGTTNATGASLSINTYDEYGQPGSSNTGRFQYTGQAWLADAGLYHYKARAYAPALGSFLQTDPISYAGGMNLYAYVSNDPINFVDPLGLQQAPDGGCGSGCSQEEDIIVRGGCPVTEDCYTSPFNAAAFGGTRGANTLPRRYGEPLDDETITVVGRCDDACRRARDYREGHWTPTQAYVLAQPRIIIRPFRPTDRLLPQPGPEVPRPPGWTLM